MACCSPPPIPAHVEGLVLFGPSRVFQRRPTTRIRDRCRRSRTTWPTALGHAASCPCSRPPARPGDASRSSAATSASAHRPAPRSPAFARRRDATCAPSCRHLGPTLVVHGAATASSPRHGRYLAEHIPDASSWSCQAPTICLDGDSGGDRWTRSRSSSPACARAPEHVDRVLATVLFTDIVGSTEHAAELGDRPGATCSTPTTRRARELRRAGAARSIGRATASSPPSTGRPARSAARSAVSTRRAQARARGAHRAAHRRGRGARRRRLGLTVHIGARVAALGGTGRGARLQHASATSSLGSGIHVRRPRAARS